MKLSHKIIILVIVILVLGGSVFIISNKINLNTDKTELIINPESSISENQEDKSDQIENIPQIDTAVIEKENSSEIPADQVIKADDPSEKIKDKPTSDLKIISKLVSWGFRATQKKRQIDTIIIHTSYDAAGEPYNLAGVLQEYRDYAVSSHYLIDRKGHIYLLVEEKNVAYHAGLSQVPDGRSDVNDFSIGIELLNTKTDKLTSDQYAKLNQLVSSIKKKYKIKYVLGHNQIAPQRKDDPWNFNWKMLE